MLTKRSAAISGGQVLRATRGVLFHKGCKNGHQVQLELDGALLGKRLHYLLLLLLR